METSLWRGGGGDMTGNVEMMMMMMMMMCGEDFLSSFQYILFIYIALYCVVVCEEEEKRSLVKKGTVQI